ncbi:hypothetical protein QVO10_07795 [Bacteroides gallinaceum]|uniref:Fimbrillin family protein n=1 Tax=Bacteroides gallinaceum TaxID=1462571 RepID=A0ABT7X5B7_9BACE|nr:hypothetical protein [Bacteroides gallinaceum]MDN0049286.1 hypothetical protein [Bacteroides gallinaceum]
MKKFIGLWFWSILLFAISSCSEDEEPVFVPEEEEEILITGESGTTVVNTKDIVLGVSEDDVVFEMTSTILTTSGRVTETTLNCCAMAGINFTDNGGMLAMDTLNTVEDVVLINRGTITIHTKDLVERYKDQIQTPDDPERPYTYLRLLAMFAGTNSTIINEGIINVYFDHDPSVTSTIYVMGMNGGGNSSMINNGEIHFYGNGSVATRLRGMATFGNSISAFNNGVMTAELDMCEDARMITTGGTKSNVINDGTMQMRLPGYILCMTRYGDSNLINNGVVDLTMVDLPEGYTAVGNAENPVVCAMYDPLSGGRTQMPSLVNRGRISIAIEGSERSNSVSQGYGMYCDLMGAGGGDLQVNVINDGSIKVSQSGPVDFRMAEAGFITRPAVREETCCIKLGRWNTTLRDFSQTQDLFYGQGVNMDFGGGELLLKKGEDYVDGTSYSVAPEALLYNGGRTMFRYEYSGYENFDIKAADESNVNLTWDKENNQVSLSDK